MFLKLVILVILSNFWNHPVDAAVTCTYEIDTRDNSYVCRLVNQVIRNENDMATISGTHLDGKFDESVTKLFGTNSTIEIFPTAVIDKFVNLQNIWLAGVQIKSMPRAITNCAYVQSINLNFNEIFSLPDNIFTACEALVELMLMGNDMKTIGNNAFSGLAKLESLELQRNNITAVTANLFSPVYNLKKLNLNVNQISNFPFEILSILTKLTELHLSDNKITRFTSPTTLYPSVKVLHLSGNEISTIEPTDFRSFISVEVFSVGSLLESIPVISNLNSLRELRLDGNKIKTVTLSSVRNYNNLQSLYISDNLIESVNFTALSTPSLENLQVLFLRNNKITNLDDNSFTGLTRMTHLDLTGNQIVKLKAKDITITSTLRVLDVTSNKIDGIEREVFKNATILSFRAKGNVCTDADYEINRDFDTKIAPLLEKCLNFGITMKANVIVLIVATLLSFVVKMF